MDKFSRDLDRYLTKSDEPDEVIDEDASFEFDDDEDDDEEADGNDDDDLDLDLSDDEPVD